MPTGRRRAVLTHRLIDSAMKLYRPFPKIGETMLDAVNVLRVVWKETAAAGEPIQKLMKSGGFRADRKPQHVTDNRVKTTSIDE